MSARRYIDFGEHGVGRPGFAARCCAIAAARTLMPCDRNGAKEMLPV